MLIDTNVWGELSRPRPNPLVSDFVAAHFDQCVLSTLVLAEIRYGIALADDPLRQAQLQAFHDDLLLRAGARTLAFDTASAAAWGPLRARLRRQGRIITDMDMLIAAQAIAHRMPVATRNERDFASTGAEVVNPWSS